MSAHAQDQHTGHLDYRASHHEQGILDRSLGFGVASIAGALMATVLIAAVWWDGAFDLRYWAPMTLLALALLCAQAAAGTLTLPRRGPLAVATVAIWCLAGFTLLSAAWSDSAAGAWSDGARTVFYAALWTQALAVAAEPRWKSRFGLGLTVAVGAIGVVTLIVLLINGEELFRAGRLESPVGYRNGTAALFAFGVMPLLGLAARHGLAAGVRAAAFAAAVIALGLAFLTQSRGVAIGLVIGGAVWLAIGGERLRRVWLGIAAAAVVGVISSRLLVPYDAFSAGTEVVGAKDIRAAALALAAAAAAAFFVAMLAFVFDNGLRSGAVYRRTKALAVAMLVGLLALGGIAGLVKVGNPVSYVDAKVGEFNETDTAVSGSTRLGSVGGQRSDLWRVAWGEFQANPLVGAGVGSYQFAYFRERETDRNLNNPHSLPLKLLAETGLVGAALFAIWLGAAAVAIVRRARERPPSARLWTGAMAAAGTAVLAQSAVDWFWLLPALFGLGVFAVGLAAGADDGRERIDAMRQPFGRAIAVAGLAALVLSVALLFIGNFYVRKARIEAYASPQAQLSAARTAAALLPVAVVPRYLQASAFESEGRREEARGALREALSQEPENFVTLGLLGDLETRAGNEARARGYYRRALALNPHDVGLRQLSETSQR